MAIKSNGLHRLKEILSKRIGRVEPEVEAVVALLLSDSVEPEILLVQRAERNSDPWSGHMGLPGGRIKPSDLSPIDASKREVLEEVGLDLDDLDAQLFGPLDASYPWNRPEMKVQPFVYGLELRPRVQLGPEVVEAFWVELSKLPGLKARSEVETRGGKRMVDSFLVDGRIVWGFTYRVLAELLDLMDGWNY